MNLPNALTLLRIALTPVFIHFYLLGDQESLLIAISVFVVASFTDWYDGYYARKTNSITRFGQFMDPLADKVLNLSATYLFMKSGFLAAWIFYFILFRDSYTTLLRMYALMNNQAVVTSRIAQWKTFIHMALLATVFTQLLLNELFQFELIALNSNLLSIFGMAWLITALLSFYTSIGYTIDNWKHIMQLWRSLLKLIRWI
jgi:CDP-diacylglycerol--glycerol-3-phosphate 3-phosphatidyltransferase